MTFRHDLVLDLTRRSGDPQGSNEGSKEKWGPWQLDTAKLKALVSLWAYNFKKSTRAPSHRVNPLQGFYFVIGPVIIYEKIYKQWITRYSPQNPVYMTSASMVALRTDAINEYCVGALLPGAMLKDVVASTRPPKDLKQDREAEYIAYHYFCPDAFDLPQTI